MSDGWMGIGIEYRQKSNRTSAKSETQIIYAIKLQLMLLIVHTYSICIPARSPNSKAQTKVLTVYLLIIVSPLTLKELLLFFHFSKEKPWEYTFKSCRLCIWMLRSGIDLGFWTFFAGEKLLTHFMKFLSYETWLMSS